MFHHPACCCTWHWMAKHKYLSGSLFCENTGCVWLDLGLPKPPSSQQPKPGLCTKSPQWLWWSKVTWTISSGSLSEEVGVSDRRQLPMSLETEDTLKKSRLRDKNYHFQSCHSNHVDIETLPSRKKILFRGSEKRGKGTWSWKTGTKAELGTPGHTPRHYHSFGNPWQWWWWWWLAE